MDLIDPRPHTFRVSPPAASDPKSIADARERFIAAWGQMGGVWGISRTMAEVHALLYITDEPLCTDEVMERLQISRGNASMSLRALMDWGIIVRTHKRGDRKEYFRAEQDVWAMARAIVRERLKREVEPLVAGLYEIRDLTGVDTKPPRARRKASGAEEADPAAIHNKRLDAILDLMVTIERVSETFIGPAGRGLQAAASILSSPLLGGSRGRKHRASSPRAEGTGAAAESEHDQERRS